MYFVVTALHVIACLMLIGVILLQSGRGGGLSEMLGGAGGQSQKLFGTQTSDFLTKATSYAAIVFLITSVTLGILTSQRSKSVLESAEIKPLFSENAVSSFDDLKKQVAEDLEKVKADASPAVSEAEADAVKAADQVQASAQGE